jgi:hypothetical protein
MENFIEIPDTQGEYMVSDAGQIKSMKTNRLLKFSKGSSGYSQVGLRAQGRKRTIMVHRLVAAAHVPNPLNLPVVNHINGDKLDNRATNLEWCTYSQNSIHANRAGLTPPPPKWAKGKFGADHNRSKKVYAYKADGSLFGEYGSGNEAGRLTGIKEAAVAKALQNGGFTRGSRLLFSHTALATAEVAEQLARIAGLYKAAGKKRSKSVKAINANGETIGEYTGMAEAGVAHGLTAYNVMDCLRFGRPNSKTGIRFEYA